LVKLILLLRESLLIIMRCMHRGCWSAVMKHLILLNMKNAYVVSSIGCF